MIKQKWFLFKNLLAMVREKKLLIKQWDKKLYWRDKKYKKDTIIFVDNCYGEFVEENEPTSVGADIIAGSLTKNPGGGIVPFGGYVAGKKNLIEKCSSLLSSLE